MNKRREALRRGLRSFIQDTSRELAELEGRDAAPPVAAPSAITPDETPETLPDRAHPSPAPPSGAPDPAAEDAADPPAARGHAVAPPPIETPVADPAMPEPAVRAEPPEIAPSPAPVGEAKPRRRSRGPARRRAGPRAAAEIGSNGLRAEQIHARKGVCFAYFLNHECWRIPEAYCNSALQVCITRECPVYHLHKEALERRFARKFRHFW